MWDPNMEKDDTTFLWDEKRGNAGWFWEDMPSRQRSISGHQGTDFEKIPQRCRSPCSYYVMKAIVVLDEGLSWGGWETRDVQSRMRVSHQGGAGGGPIFQVKQTKQRSRGCSHEWVSHFMDWSLWRFIVVVMENSPPPTLAVWSIQLPSAWLSEQTLVASTCPGIARHALEMSRFRRAVDPVSLSC